MPNSATFHFGQFQDAGARTSLAEIAFSEVHWNHLAYLGLRFYGLLDSLWNSKFPCLAPAFKNASCGHDQCDRI